MKSILIYFVIMSVILPSNFAVASSLNGKSIEIKYDRKLRACRGRKCNWQMQHGNSRRVYVSKQGNFTLNYTGSRSGEKFLVNKWENLVVDGEQKKLRLKINNNVIRLDHIWEDMTEWEKITVTGTNCRIAFRQKWKDKNLKSTIKVTKIRCHIHDGNKWR